MKSKIQDRTNFMQYLTEFVGHSFLETSGTRYLPVCRVYSSVWSHRALSTIFAKMRLTLNSAFLTISTIPPLWGLGALPHSGLPFYQSFLFLFFFNKSTGVFKYKHPTAIGQIKPRGWPARLRRPRPSSAFENWPMPSPKGP